MYCFLLRVIWYMPSFIHAESRIPWRQRLNPRVLAGLWWDQDSLLTAHVQSHVLRFRQGPFQRLCVHLALLCLFISNKVLGEKVTTFWSLFSSLVPASPSQSLIYPFPVWDHPTALVALHGRAESRFCHPVTTQDCACNEHCRDWDHNPRLCLCDQHGQGARASVSRSNTCQCACGDVCV